MLPLAFTALQGDSLTLGGFVLPDSSPPFLGILAVHVAAGLTAVIAGAVAMLSPKAPGRHPRWGTTYYWALWVVVVTNVALAIVRWPLDVHLAVLGMIALGLAFAGRRARRRGRPGWERIHIPCMGASYTVLLTAFYVDNGHQLPLWRVLPQWSYWVIPAAVATPLILRALRRWNGRFDITA